MSPFTRRLTLKVRDEKIKVEKLKDGRGAKLSYNQ